MSLIEYLKSIDSPTLINVIETLHLRPNERGFTPVGVRCLFPEMGRMCGYAVTAQVETVTQMEPFHLETFVELYRSLEQAPKPAVIVLQEVGGFREYAAHCGEVMSTFFTRLGAVGLVSDCAVRDLPEVRQLGFHYFALGSVASHANFRIARVGVPVQIHGMAVNPGDVIHADENGVITVPAAPLETIRAAVESVRQKEKKVLDFVRSEKFSLDGFRELVVE
ncbi:MAG: RraA family protein [Bryobacterales bacterium]|nr:RraA family protein [Bryobacterales bacterium]